MTCTFAFLEDLYFQGVPAMKRLARYFGLLAATLVAFGSLTQARADEEVVLSCEAHTQHRSMVNDRIEAMGRFYSAGERARICKVTMNDIPVVGVGDSLSLAVESLIVQCEILFGQVSPGNCSGIRKELLANSATYCKTARLN
jgi:hypothetical protein